MKVVVGYPPNIDLIEKTFPDVRSFPAVACYGDTIYDFQGVGVPDHLEFHEARHSKRQAEVGVDEWWRRFLTDVDFRIEEEVDAYGAQVAFIRKHRSRDKGAHALMTYSKALAGPIYGNCISNDEARSRILASSKKFNL